MENNIDADRWYLYVGVSSFINYNPPLQTSDILVFFSQVDVQSKEAILIKTQIKTQFHNVSFSVIRTVSFMQIK